MWKNVFLWFVPCVQGPPGQKGDPGATEIIDYNGNIQEALQVRPAAAATAKPSVIGKKGTYLGVAH